MKYAILLVAASMTIFTYVDVFASNYLNQDNLVSCTRSEEQPPANSTSGSSGA